MPSKPREKSWLPLTGPLVALALIASLFPGVQAAEPALGFNGVALWQDGKAQTQRVAQGYLKPVDEIGEMSTTASFPVISVTKLFTAVLVMREAERGTLELAQTVGSLWPTFPDAAVRAVTIRQLLQHTSGLPNLDDVEPEVDGVSGYYAQTPIVASDLQKQVRKLAHGPLAFEPGSKFSYNNLDYLMLGALLERVSGGSYEDLLQKRFLKPLGMKATKLAATPVPTYVAGATLDDGLLLTPPRVYLQNFGPAGALISTVDDLSTFVGALLGGRLLRPASLAELFRGDPQLGYVALGVWSYPFKDAAVPQPVDVVERQGETAGYRASLIMIPSRHAWLILLSNTDAMDFMTWNPASATHRLLAGLLKGDSLQALLASSGAMASQAPAPVGAPVKVDTAREDGNRQVPRTVLRQRSDVNLDQP